MKTFEQSAEESRLSSESVEVLYLLEVRASFPWTAQTAFFVLRHLTQYLAW